MIEVSNKNGGISAVGGVQTVDGKDHPVMKILHPRDSVKAPWTFRCPSDRCFSWLFRTRTRSQR
jgi:hypothetical protein